METRQYLTRDPRLAEPVAIAMPVRPDMVAYPGSEPSNPPDAPSRSGFPMWLLAGAAAAGAVLAVAAIPAWLPVLGGSLVGAEPKVYWYLSRASAVVSFVLLWVSMASGLLITNRLARVWPGAFTAFDLHQFTSFLGLGFGLLHALLLLGDQYIGYSLVQVFVPFVNAPYRAFWVGLGQLALYLTALVTFTFYVRKQLGNRLWHVIHVMSYGAFALFLLHGLFSGTDSANAWMGWMYWLSAASLVGLTIHRVMVRGLSPVTQ